MTAERHIRENFEKGKFLRKEDGERENRTNAAKDVKDDRYLEPTEAAVVEEKIKRSLFIGRLFLCRNPEEVRSKTTWVENEHRNASHNCRAYILGPEADVEYGTDDGEPSGTAGKPILGAIRRSGMTNTLVVVTRYFGGIKLGVRGLTEAYGGVATAVVARAQPVERIRSRRVVISLPYDIIGEVAHVLNNEGMVGDPVWIYGEKVEVATDVRISAVSRVAGLLDELQARRKIHSWKWVSI
jgi:uncharacterized YigZ family protein